MWYAGRMTTKTIKSKVTKAVRGRARRASKSDVSIEDDERYRDQVDGYISRNRDSLNASIRKSRKEIAEGRVSSKSIGEIISEGRRRHSRGA